MSDNSIDPVRLIYTFDVNIFGFLMNPDNAILILALVAFILGASMNFLIAGSIIAAVLVIFYYLVVAMKRSQAWPPVKTLCPDQYYVKQRISDEVSGKVTNIVCAPMYPSKIRLGSAMTSQNPEFQQEIQDNQNQTRKEACNLANGMGLIWEACS